MAELNRKALREIFENAGIEIPPKDVLGQICELHTQSLDGMSDTIKELNEKLSKAEQESKDESGFKKKYEEEHKAFEDYKADVASKESKAAKESAVRAYFESKNIRGSNLEIAMRGCAGEVDAIELENGKIKDAKALDELVSGTFAGLVQSTSVKGANTANPPANVGSKKTKAEIMAIKDRDERLNAIAENHELFGI